MANIYVRSTDGVNTDDGSTWALAKLDLAGAAAIDAAGDTIFVSDAHAESTATAITIALAGTLASPVRVICGDDIAEPPTAVTATGTVTTTGASAISITGSAYVYGLSFLSGTGTSSSTGIVLGQATGWQAYKNCSFQVVVANSSADITLGSSSSTAFYKIRWEDCTVKFAQVGQTITISQCRFEWFGGSVLAGGTTPTGLFTFGGDGGVADIVGVDFSNLATTFNLFVTTAHAAKATIRNCKLPASWTGILGVPTGPAQRYEMYNCDSGDTNYKLWISDYAGSVRDETTIKRTGGASDGTTGLSWNMTSGADAEYPVLVLRAPEIVIWNDTTGGAKTVTIEVVTDNVTLTDAEAWIEVQYLGTAGFPLAVHISAAKADVLATAASQTTSTETWTTTGLTTPVKQKLSVTFTPQEKGFFHIVPCLAKASTTMYVCPKPAVT